VEAMFITTSKALTSKMLQKEGINTPLAFLPSQREMLQGGNRYILKPEWEDGSFGITPDSVFTYSRDYDNVLSKYDDSHWIIQEFIDGRKFNISLLYSPDGPKIMPPAEIVFRNFEAGRPKIVDFRAKWIPESFECVNTVRDFPDDKLDPALSEKIREAALRCWEVFGLKGYARVDMRVDNYNNPFVIEVNANPCISPDSGLVAATIQAGLPSAEVIRRIVSDLNNK